METGLTNKELFDNLVAGVVYDFAAWLTGRPERLTISAQDDAAPVADAVALFLDIRGIHAEDPLVKDWEKAIIE